MANTNKQNINDIGTSIGQLLELEQLQERIACKRLLRIKVGFNICNSLMEGFSLPRPNMHDAFISFRYEESSDFCYKCGWFGQYSLYVPKCDLLEIWSLVQSKLLS